MKYVKIVLAITLLSSSTGTIAAGPGSGSKSKNNIQIANCWAEQVTVKWNLDSLLGEPVVNGSFKWSANQQCDIPPSTKIYLKLTDGSGWGFVRLSPVTPKANAGYGYNTPGSPNWNKAVCGSGNRDHDCFDKSSAIYLWKHGYITDFEIHW